MAKRDWFELYNKTVRIQTKKDWFYYIIDDGVKYIHKHSLKVRYEVERESKTDFDDIDYILKNYKLFPKIKYNNYFYYFKFVEGEPISDITQNEFYYLKENFDINGYTTFYAGMYLNIIRSGSGLFLIDPKHFRPITGLPFFLCLSNNMNINKIYIERCDEHEHENIISYLRGEHPQLSKDHIIWM